MGKKAKQARRQAANPQSSSKPQTSDKPATLKDMLSKDTLAKLKAQSDAWKEEETRQAAAKKQQEEEAKRAERKRLENDFAYLLENSSDDWRKFKS